MPKRKDKQKLRNKYVDYLMYIAMRLFMMFVHMFSWGANYRTARMIGDLMFRFDKKHRERAMRHLQLSFPDWPAERYLSVARDSVRSMLYLGLEVLFTTRMITAGRWRKHVTLKNIVQMLELITERKSGFIMLTGHYGNWEVVGYTMATLGYPVFAVARMLDNPYINKYVLDVRQRNGMRILDKRGATMEMDQLLTDKQIVAFIADQDAGKKGMFVDFFGRKASTYKSIALMAMQYEVPVIIGYGRRMNEAYHFEMGIERIITPNEWADKEDPARWITQEYTTALENSIRRHPEQYLWVHRRWKHRPRGETAPADGIA